MAAMEWVALPGTSEHQLGIAVDIIKIVKQLLKPGKMGIYT